MSDLLRVYLDPAEIGRDGYPYAWHNPVRNLLDAGKELAAELAGRPLDTEWLTKQEVSIKDVVREQAGHRCVRCGHPYRSGEHGNGEWSPCDEHCTHGGPTRIRVDSALAEDRTATVMWEENARGGPQLLQGDGVIEAQWRILTVHHLNGIKHDCTWGNLVALCQRCHLSVQTRVVMGRAYHFEHSEWFKPYAAFHYARAYLGEDLSREATEERLDELLALELQQERLPGV